MADNRTNAKRGWIALLSCLAVMAVVWLVLLPWLGSQPQLRERIDREKAAGINPDAMFYTELECMPAISRRLGE